MKVIQNDSLRKIAIYVVGALCVSAISVVAASDAPPLAGVTRVDNLKSMQLEFEISQYLFFEYCPAVISHNRIAEEAASRWITQLEDQYSKINYGLAVPLRPCP